MALNILYIEPEDRPINSIALSQALWIPIVLRPFDSSVRMSQGGNSNIHLTGSAIPELIQALELLHKQLTKEKE